MTFNARDAAFPAPRRRSFAAHSGNLFSKPALILLMLLLSVSAASVEAASDISLGPAIDGPSPPVPPAVISRDESGRATIRAVRVKEQIVLDGRLDEDVYRAIPAISDFVQQEPREGQPATERTEVWILFDDRNLYVAARCLDSQPQRMVVNEMRRDQPGIGQNENFVVALDTFHDRRNGFFFQINPLGGMRDALVTDEGNAINVDWNTIWDTRTTMTDNGWTVEIVIPFKSLRYRAGRDQVWGVILRRIVRWKNENTFIVPVPASFGPRGMYKFSSAATLVGVEAPLSSLNLELKPYGISGVQTDRTATPVRSNDLTGNAGFDAKYGLTRGLVADFTYNTDFAQVEEDEQQVNLTRFSLFFPEKREFFLEGQGIFAFGGASGGWGGGENIGAPSLVPVMFFSRRIGLHEGETIPIRGGGRVTGRAGAYSIGLLDIQSGESGSASAPSTNFSVVRIRRDILRRSAIGVIGTNRTPGLDGNGSNQVFGVDANLAFYQNLEMKGYYARSRTPDQSGKNASYRGLFDYGGDRYGLIYEHLTVDDEFNPEIGFMRRSDFRRNYVQLRFSPRPKQNRRVRKYSYEASVDRITDGTGLLETREVQGTFRIEFQSGDRFNVEYTRAYEYLKDDFEIADGVVLPVGGYAFQNAVASYQLGPQRRMSGGVSFRRGSFYNGRRTETGYNGRIKMTNRLSVEPRVSINWVDLPADKFTTKVVSARTNYALTQRMFVAALLQYNSSSNAFSTNARFRWEYRPGSDLFVVYSEGRDTSLRGFPQMQNRGFVVKLTRLLRF